MMTAVFAMGAIPGEKITVKGSDTMVILAQRWAEKYMAAHPDVVIQVTGGGTGTGISALINGTTDICNASRPMKDSERLKIQEKYGSRGVEIRAALDGVAVYVNERNPVKDLTLDQLKDIYTGKITNWKEVGGARREDHPVRPGEQLRHVRLFQGRGPRWERISSPPRRICRGPRPW